MLKIERHEMGKCRPYLEKKRTQTVSEHLDAGLSVFKATIINVFKELKENMFKEFVKSMTTMNNK